MVSTRKRLGERLDGTMIGRLALAVALVFTVLVGVPGTPAVQADTNEGAPGVARGAVSAVTGGESHTCALLNGAVKCWGSGANGRLGNNNTTDIGDGTGPTVAASSPIDIGPGRTATAITAGFSHTCVLLDNNTIKCWGGGSLGQLGNSAATNIGDGTGPSVAASSPIDLGTGRTATAITAGGSHTCALLDNNTIKCWGVGANGRLGNNANSNIGDGTGPTVAASPPIDLGPGRTATAITAGNSHTCALLDNNTIKCWGNGAPGQLGNNATTNIGDGTGPSVAASSPIDLGTGRTATAITAGGSHTCALLDNNTIKCWGAGDNGALGSGATTSIGDGTGPTIAASQPVDVGAGRSVTSISAGGLYTCAVLDNKTVKCWGWGSTGQLGSDAITNIGDGTGPSVAASSPIDLGTGRTANATTTGTSHACAVLDDNTMKCWGLGGNGQLGNNATTNIGDVPMRSVASASAIDLGFAPASVASVSTGNEHTCVVLTNGALRCWGEGDFGRLGYNATADIGDADGEMGGNLASVNLGVGRTAKSVDAGAIHTCAVLDDDSVKCWGSGGAGRLGNNGGGDILDVAAAPAINLGPGRTAKAVAAGGDHTCALLDNNTVKCWGSGAVGQLGDNATTGIVDVSTAPVIDFGPGRTAKAVTAGLFHNCALLDDDTVKCWGRGDNGQLGNGSTNNIGDGVGSSVAASPAIGFGVGRSAKAVTASDFVTCALLDDDSVKCWGNGSVGRLGSGGASNIGDGVGLSVAAAPAVDLGTGRTAKSVSAGNGHVCAILDNDATTCWGFGANGQLGTGNIENIGDAAVEMGDALVPAMLGTGRTATAVSAGNLYTCAVLDNARVKCWGNGGSGRLGNGGVGDVGINIGQLGNNLLPVDIVDANNPYTVVSAPSGPAAPTAATIAPRSDPNDPQANLAFRVMWTPPTDTGSSPITGYRLQFGTSSDDSFFDLPATPSFDGVTSFATAGPIRVAAITAVGVGPYGAPTPTLANSGPPSVTIAPASGQADPATSAPIRFTATFSQPVTGLTSTDIALSGTAGATTAALTGSGTTYSISVTGMTKNGTVDVAIPAEAAVNANLQGNVAANRSVTYSPPVDPVSPSAPERFVDTRPNGETLDDQFEKAGKRAADTEYKVMIAGRGNVPTGAPAVVVNITAIGPEGTGFVTAHPCTTPRPLASSLNYTTGVNLGNEVIAPLNAAGELCLYTSAAAHLTVDVTGYIAATSPLVPITPARFLDTRPTGTTFDTQAQAGTKPAAGSSTTLQITGRGTVPANAAAVIVNVTAIGAEATGYVTAHPCLATPPNAASLNYVSGVNRGNELIANLDSNGRICLFTSATTHLSADVVGYLPGGTNLVAVGPARLLDTRANGDTIDNQSQAEGKRQAGTEYTLQVTGRAGVPAGATSAVINITAVAAENTGFLTIHPCLATRPNTASLNYITGVNGGNEIVTQLDANGRACIYTSATTHLTADIVAHT